MDILVLVFLSSGLFLGWSLGANDASNVFGTAVASRMITFTTAAMICAVFVVLGAVISGAGAAHGLGALGSVNTLAGAFMSAFSAALTVLWMTRVGLPVSTTQAVVGAIIGWNLYSGSLTDLAVLSKIVATWVACPLLGAMIAAMLYRVTVRVIYWSKMHLLRLDWYTRAGLVLAGAFGSYALGANNIGNVMGVFVSASPFTDVTIGDSLTFTSVQQLFLVGAIAIAVGVFTYSRRVMMTVGSSLMPLNPQAAWVVVVAHSLVLFLFSSVALESFLAGKGLPTIPLIPVSSSQAVVGAVIGIGLLKGRQGARQVRWRVLGNIAAGWVFTPVIAAIVCFILLFVLQNVFNQQVYRDTHYRLSPEAVEYLGESGVATDDLGPLVGRTTAGGQKFRRRLRKLVAMPHSEEAAVIAAATLFHTEVSAEAIGYLSAERSQDFADGQLAALRRLAGQRFEYRWALERALAAEAPVWRKRPASKVNKAHNQHLDHQLSLVYQVLATDAPAP